MGKAVTPAVQPEQPFWGRVTSIMKFGALIGVAAVRKDSQSVRLRGEKSFVPLGQLFVSFDLDTSRQFSHFTKEPGV